MPRPHARHSRRSTACGAAPVPPRRPPAIKTRQLRHGKAALTIAARGQEIALLVNPTGSSLDVVIRDVEEAARASGRRLSILKD